MTSNSFVTKINLTLCGHKRLEVPEYYYLLVRLE